MGALQKLNAIETDLLNRVNYFEKRFKFRRNTKISEMKGNFFKASNYRAYMEAKSMLKTLRNLC